jgi:large subunit ribosomal protein L15
MLMNLNEIRDNKNAIKDRKRIGRGIGSGTGKTSGKGHKGQKARSGVAVKGFEGGQMPIHRRLPKRGFTNINRVTFTEINLNKIEEMISTNKIDPKKAINSQYLLELGLIKKINSRVKILAKGIIKNKINIEVSAVSSKAKELIEQVGGSVTLIEKKKPENKKVKKSEA